MSFIVRTERPDEWKAVASLISTLVDEATFEVTSEGISFRAMDPSHVAMLDLFWPNSGFERFECDGEVKFTIRINEFNKILKRSGKNDEVELRSEEEGLTVKLEGKYRRAFKLHFIESTYAPARSPKFSFKAKCLVDIATFRDILKDIGIVSDHVTIEARKGELLFIGKGETGTAKVELVEGQPELKELSIEEESRSTYSIKFISDVTNPASKLTDETSMEFSSRLPLKLGFKLGDTGGKVDFYLAPRLE